MWSSGFSWSLPLVLLSTLPARVLGGDVLSISGYSLCSDNPSISVQALDISFDRKTNLVVFNVAGTSSEEQNITANVAISAYGRLIYSKSLEPCGAENHIPQLCPGNYRPLMFFWYKQTNS